MKSDAPFNFSALNNLGAFRARGEVLALVNNDIEVTEPDWMAKLVAHAVDPSTGPVGCRLVYPDGRVQHGGIVVGLFDDFAQHAFRNMDGGEPGYRRRAVLDQWASAVTAACLFIRKDVFEKLGGLDEEFPVDYNDTDFCLKAAHAGYRVVYAGSVTCIHKESQTRAPSTGADRDPESARALADMVVRWGAGYVDRYYNPNLALWPAAYRLSSSPRVFRPWYR